MSPCFQYERELNFPFDWPASVSNILTVRKWAEPKIVGRNFTSRIRPMSSIRYKVWISHTGRKGASILPKLKSLPPTVEAFRENVKRAHFQACIWKAALQLDPPELDLLIKV